MIKSGGCGVQDLGEGPRSWPSTYLPPTFTTTTTGCHQHPSQKTRGITKYTLTILRGAFYGYSI